MKNKTRDRILKAALETMAEKGYKGATTREIALRAGVCELTLFRHFGTKQNLFRELLNKHSFVPALREIISYGKGSSVHHILKKIGIEFYKTMHEKKSIMRVVLSEVALKPEPVASLIKEIIFQCINELKSYLTLLKTNGIIKETNEELVARTFFGSIFAFFHTEEIVLNRNPKTSSVEEFIDTLTDTILKGILIKE